MRRRLGAEALALVTGLAGPTYAYGQGYGPGMMGGYGWGFGMFGMLLWWVLIILGIGLLAKWLFSGAAGGGRQEAGNRALEILKERYARGEIDKKEFEERKRDLGG